MEFNVLGMKISFGKEEEIKEIDESVEVEETPKELVKEDIVNDMSNSTTLGDSKVVGVQEQVVSHSPKDLKKMIDSNDLKMSTLLDALKLDYSDGETYKENEDMSKDTIVGSAMEMMADDCCMANPATKKVVNVSSGDPKLKDFLEVFLESNVEIEKRIWEWAFEVVKHGDFKLRRLEFDKGKGKSKGVYYENVSEGYKVFRVEYLGKVLGFLDTEDGESVLRPKEDFVHFMSSKLPNRKKIKMKVKDKEGKLKEIKCYKVAGSSLVDNARYIYRIVNTLDNMLIMSRIARSTQYNIVKIEVGNASETKTQQILMDVRRRIEGSTRMTKGKGVRTDPSPIPVNSNVYIPTREGKGDIQVESVNDSTDVKSIVDIDYFRNKEFATIKTPKAYLGFEEELPGSMGNTSLVKLDIRYARNVNRGLKVLQNGIKDLCNNYLTFRGRPMDVNKFDIELRSVMTAEDTSRIEDLMNNMSVFDSMATVMSEFGDYVDKVKILILLLGMVGIDAADVGSQKLIDIINKIEREETKDDAKNEEAKDVEDEDLEDEDLEDENY